MNVLSAQEMEENSLYFVEFRPDILTGSRMLKATKFLSLQEYVVLIAISKCGFVNHFQCRVISNLCIPFFHEFKTKIGCQTTLMDPNFGQV